MGVGWTMKFVRRLFIAIMGGTVILIGVAMIVLPGPGILVILAGMGILALEFAWAKHLLHKMKSYMPRRKNGKNESPLVQEGEKKV